MEELARRTLIRPVITQGHIGDVLPDKIGLRRPNQFQAALAVRLFNNEGKVIGINFAMVARVRWIKFRNSCRLRQVTSETLSPPRDTTRTRCDSASTLGKTHRIQFVRE